MIKKNTKEYIKDRQEQGLYGVDFLQTEHPGQTLKDELDTLGITQKELAMKTGYTVQTISRIVNGKEPITTEMAVSLERIFGGHPSVHFWLKMQMEYDKEIIKNKELNKTEEILFFKNNVQKTFKELQKGGIFEKYILNKKEKYQQAIVDIKDFFGSVMLRNIPNEAFLGVAWRKGNKKNLNEYNLAAILKIGDRKAKKVLKNNKISKYSKSNFINILNTLKKLYKNKPESFLQLLQEEVLEAGVVVVYVPNMTNTVFGGATFWIADRPVILLKIENQWEDIFWFNFYHEAGHIILHSKKEVFVDFEDNEGQNTIEEEADKFASKRLIPNFEKIKSEISGRNTLDMLVQKIALKTNVPVPIVAGRLGRFISTFEAWKDLSRFRPTIKEKANFN